MSDTKNNNPVPNFYRASAENFKKIPGIPIAYWVSNQILNLFSNNKQIYEYSISDGQNVTADNDKYLRLNWEVDFSKVGINNKWVFYSKGGVYRKWFGNLDYVVDWSETARKNYRKNPSARIIPEYLWFKEGITWTLITSSKQSFRFLPNCATFDKGGSSIFFKNNADLQVALLFLNTRISEYLLGLFNDTLNLQVDDVRRLPLSPDKNKIDENLLKQLIKISKSDWDSYETSWDFTTLPLLSPEYLSPTIEASYQKLRIHWQEMTNDMLSLEEENNKIFIEAYGMQDELTPDVPLSEITLTCNPHYRYDANKPEEELESLLLADTIKELISYAVGCMVGRYSLDKPGLILANQGETIDDYLEQIPEPSFKPDDDNIIPVLDDEYFTDDIVYRFKDFLKTVFGEKTLSQNLDYIAKALTGKSSSSPEKVIRDYFLRDFYKDHLRRYKKRPIYWMFSSGKQQGFNALVYMHRYNKATLSKMRTDYLLELEAKLEAELTSLSEDPVKNKARISKIKKQVDEMRTWDELLNNKALALIEIDLDDGVVVNYAKFEGLVRKI